MSGTQLTVIVIFLMFAITCLYGYSKFVNKEIYKIKKQHELDLLKQMNDVTNNAVNAIACLRKTLDYDKQIDEDRRSCTKDSF